MCLEREKVQGDAPRGRDWAQRQRLLHTVVSPQRGDTALRCYKVSRHVDRVFYQPRQTNSATAAPVWGGRWRGGGWRGARSGPIALALLFLFSTTRRQSAPDSMQYISPVPRPRRLLVVYSQSPAANVCCGADTYVTAYTQYTKNTVLSWTFGRHRRLPQMVPSSKKLKCVHSSLSHTQLRKVVFGQEDF
jgi:hypothetical protein